MSSGELLAERGLRDSDRYERDRSYWLQRIDELPPAPELPARDARNDVARFERHELTLRASEWDALRRRAGNRGLTPAGMILAAYAEVIRMWSRRPVFTLNLIIPSRLPLRLDVDRLADNVPSAMLLAVDQNWSGSFASRASALGRRLADDLDHPHFSGVEVMREIGQRRGRGSARMPVAFTSEFESSDQVGGLGELGWGITQTREMWINCHAMDRNGVLGVNLDVQVGVLPDGLVPDMAQAFHRLLVDLASGADAWASRWPVDLPIGQHLRRKEVNATAAPVPELLLHDRVCTQARRTPQRTALLWPGGSMTYGELLCRARAVTAALGEVRPGDLVAVLMDKGWEQVAAVLGAGLAGAAYLPIDTTQPPVLRGQILAHAGVREVLTQSRIAQATTLPTQLRVTAVDRLDPIAMAGPAPTRGGCQDDLAYVIYDFDSASRPRGVMIPHRAAVNTVEDINARFDISSRDRVLGLADLSSDLSVYDIFGVLGAGGTLVLPSPQRQADPAHWAELIAAHGVTLWNSVPAQMQMLGHYLDAVPARGLSSLRLALLSDDWIPVTLPGQLRKWLPQLQMINLGSPAGAAIWSTYHPIEDIATPIDDVAVQRRSIPYGRPLANQSCHILDGALRPRPDWVSGELYLSGTGVAKGYLGDSERTRERFIIHPRTGQRLYRTGDRGRYLPSGMIEFLGRKNTQVTISGHGVELTEVESVLQAHPAVGSAAVVADRRGTLDSRLVAFVAGARRPDAGDDELDIRHVMAEAARAVPRTISHWQVMRFMAALDRAALVSMVGALRSFGLFRNSRDAHRSDEILATARVRPSQHALIRRWLRVLVCEELLAEDVDGRLRLTELVHPRSAARAWDKVEELHAEEICPTEMLRYFRASAEQLPALMTGAVDPARMFFPEGQLRIARALYADNALARYLNEVVAATVGRIAAVQPDGVPLRVLEVGAGTGATSAQVIPALSGRTADYLFTDTSQFLLNRAEKMFRHHRWVRFGLFDVNSDSRPPGLHPHSFNVVICVGALSNAVDVPRALSRLRELLVARGWLVLVEPTRERYEILTSQGFMTNESPDPPGDTDGTVLTREQWLATLRGPGDEVALCLPKPAEPLSRLGQHVFVTQVKRDTAPVDRAELTGYVATQLPPHMAPADIRVVDALPLCGNGKVDRARLQSWLPGGP